MYMVMLVSVPKMEPGHRVNDFGQVRSGHRSVCQTQRLTRFWVLTCLSIMALFLQSNTILGNQKWLNDVKSRNVVKSQETETADINPKFRFLVMSRRFWIWRHLGSYLFYVQVLLQTLETLNNWVGSVTGSKAIVHGRVGSWVKKSWSGSISDLCNVRSCTDGSICRKSLYHITH